MKKLQHVRFNISELIQSLECYGRLKKPSISEAMSYYYNWAQARGWRLKAVVGSIAPRRIWVGTGERSNQLEIQEKDELYEVVWEAEDAEGSPDFIEHHPTEIGAVRLIEGLEDCGWEIDPSSDGYIKELLTKEGSTCRQITGRDIYRAAKELSAESTAEELSAAIKDLEANA
jgi:hypothetical protein